jgi:hypothetical protein
MASLTITTRKTRAGSRYVVRYRLGGRAYPIVHGGSFRTLREAKLRRDLIGGELAAGRNPAELLRSLTAEPPQATTTATWGERFLASRIDVDVNTIKSYRTALRKITGTFGDRDPQTITVDDVAGWVTQLAEKYKPGTVRLYVLTFRLLLDYVGLEPNPVRDSRVKMPKRVREEPSPPSAEHLLAILDAIRDPLRRLLFVTIEQGGLRLGEAVALTWGDIDRAGLRLRLPRSATKRDQARWVYLPEWQIEARELAERAGHARPSMSLDVYSHVMPAGEVADERLLALVSG